MARTMWNQTVTTGCRLVENLALLKHLYSLPPFSSCPLRERGTAPVVGQKDGHPRDMGIFSQLGHDPYDGTM